MIKNLWFNYTVKDAVVDKRLHHQLFPMQVLLEEGYSQDFIDALIEIGHNVTEAGPADGFNTITSISREGGTLYGSFDPRRGGGEDYVYSTTGGTSTVTGVSYQLWFLFVCVMFYQQYSG